MAFDQARLETLFDSVVDLPAPEASRVLDEACADAPDLRAAVERLLKRDREISSEFLEPNGSLLSKVIQENASAEAPPDPDRVGRFRILQRLGAGAMGVVYAGYDEALDRRIALKVIHDGRGATLAKEGQALARLAHPNVVHVHEIGEHEGRPFVAMELVSGRSLRAWSTERARASHETLRMFLQAGRGLAAAHAVGIVHRDFKPDNVLVGEDDRVRVVDFGVASVAGDDATSRALVGTPMFMAPEQFLREDVSAASDQFAFCVALYRALYDRAPFAGDSFSDLKKNVVAGALRAPPSNANVPAWVSPLILRGLARHAKARFTSMDELLEAIAVRLPRDVELDPNIGRRERRMLASGMVLFGLVVLCIFLIRGGASGVVHVSPIALVGIPAMVVVALGIAATFFRKRVFYNRFGRRVGSIVLVVSLTLILHRLVALHFGQPVSQIIAVDLLAVAMQFVFASILIERWLLALALVCFVGCGMTLAWPTLAFAAMASSMTATYAIAVVVWSRES